jgi:predicted DNA-binding protein with PD1-like motif
MNVLPMRLAPGADLRGVLETALTDTKRGAGFVVCGIGSLSVARLRLAGAHNPLLLEGDMEILTLAGSLSLNGAHLHMSVADADGRVWGGHVLAGCIVRTTAELMLALLPECHFRREVDPATGYAELVVSPAADSPLGQAAAGRSVAH